MAELPTARVYPRDAKDQLAVVGFHARRGGRFAFAVGRLLWTFVLASVGAAYVTSRVIAWTEPRHASFEMPRTIHLGSAADQLELIDVPSPTGRGTIKSLARKRMPPAPPLTVEEMRAARSAQ